MAQREENPTKSGEQKARAQPNQRIKEVFGIDNAFTNECMRRKGEFVVQAKKIMRAAIGTDRMGNAEEAKSEDWTQILSVARKAFVEYTEKDSNLAGLIQYVTLKTSIAYLFPDETCKATLACPEAYENIKYIGGDSPNPNWESHLANSAFAMVGSGV
jgi:hypothetical protein